MKATEFERLMALRATVTTYVMRGSSWLAIGVIGAYLIGLCLGAARLLNSMYCLHKIVSASYAWRSFGRIRLRLSDRTLVSFSTRGLCNYYVVIPSNMLSNADEIRVSLAHEYQHLRQGDIGWEILLEALKPLFLLNPAYHARKWQVEDLCELACDQIVLATGRIGIKAYCDMLLIVCQKRLRRDRTFVIAVPEVTLVTADRSALRDGRLSFLENRINTLFDARTLRHPRLVYGAVILPLMGAIMLTGMAIQSPGDWSQDGLMLSTVVNLERLDGINHLSIFGRVRD